MMPDVRVVWNEKNFSGYHVEADEKGDVIVKNPGRSRPEKIINMWGKGDNSGSSPIRETTSSSPVFSIEKITEKDFRVAGVQRPLYLTTSGWRMDDEGFKGVEIREDNEASGYQPIGSIYYKENSDSIEIRGMGLEETHREKGICTKVMERLVDEARRAGKKVIDVKSVAVKDIPAYARIFDDIGISVQADDSQGHWKSLDDSLKPARASVNLKAALPASNMIDPDGLSSWVEAHSRADRPAARLIAD